MSEIHDTDYLKAFAEGDDPSQPEEGRTDQPDPANPGDDGGSDADAESNQPAAKEPTTDAESDQPAGGEENPDEFAGLPEAVVARIKAAEAKAFRAENTLRSNESRYSRTERELNELRGRVLAQPKVEPKQPEPEAPVLSDEELTRIETEYDDLGKPLVQGFRALQAKIERLSSALDEQSSERSKQELARTEQERDEYLGRQAAILAERHSDVADIVKNPAYAQWAIQQPAFIQDMIRANGQVLVDGEAAAFVFDKFKADTKQPVDPEEQRRQRQLDGSTDVRVRAPAFTPSEIGDSGDYDEEWKRAGEEERRQARR